MIMVAAWQVWTSPPNVGFWIGGFVGTFAMAALPAAVTFKVVFGWESDPRAQRMVSLFTAGFALGIFALQWLGGVCEQGGCGQIVQEQDARQREGDAFYLPPPPRGQAARGAGAEPAIALDDEELQAIRERLRDSLADPSREYLRPRLVRVHVTDRVSLELPENWLIPDLSPYQSEILSVADAVLGPLPRELQSDSPRTVLSAVTPENMSYAAVNVVVNSNATWNEQMTITEDLISAVEQLVIDGAAAQGYSVLERSPPRIFTASTGQAFDLTLVRSDPEGPVRLVQSFHPQVGITATVTLSASVADWDHWRPVLYRVRASLRFENEPPTDTLGKP